MRAGCGWDADGSVDGADGSGRKWGCLRPGLSVASMGRDVAGGFVVLVDGSGREWGCLRPGSSAVPMDWDGDGICRWDGRRLAKWHGGIFGGKERWPSPR